MMLQAKVERKKRKIATAVAEDYGVRGARGAPMVRVAESKLRIMRGQYKFNAGVYTFSTADAGKTIIIEAA